MKKLLRILFIFGLYGCEPRFDRSDPINAFIVHEIQANQTNDYVKYIDDNGLGFYAPSRLYNIGDTVSLLKFRAIHDTIYLRDTVFVDR